MDYLADVMVEDCYSPDDSKLLLEEEATVELVQLCIRISPELVNECKYDGQTSVEKALTRNCSVDVGRCILEVFPAAVSMPNDEGNDLPLQTAIQHGCPAEIMACIFKAMPKAAVRDCCSSPLHLLLSEQIMCFGSGDPLNFLKAMARCCRRDLTKPVDSNSFDSYENEELPLHFALRYGLS
jgi:hypothetical protein